MVIGCKWDPTSFFQSPYDQFFWVWSESCEHWLSPVNPRMGTLVLRTSPSCKQCGGQLLYPNHHSGRRFCKTYVYISLLTVNKFRHNKYSVLLFSSQMWMFHHIMLLINYDMPLFYSANINHVFRNYNWEILF